MTLLPELEPIRREAEFSPGRAYRYLLRRTWLPEAESVAFVMLNPSVADEKMDDHTIRCCMRFARAWGYGGILVANLYAYCATSPDELWKALDPVGPENDAWLAKIAERAGGWPHPDPRRNNVREGATPIVAAWGMNARRDRVEAVLEIPGFRRSLRCLGTTATGAPRHPSRLAASTELLPWEPPW